MGGFFRKKIDKMLASEPSPHRLSLSCAVGTFLAFSPYLGIQTVLIFVLSWLLSLNTAVTFSVVYLINNPWTMIPIVILDYLVGAWVAGLFGINLLQYNPAWMQSFNKWINVKAGSYLAQWGIGELSFWAYFIGGHIVALACALLAYPLARYWIARMMNNIHEKVETES